MEYRKIGNLTKVVTGGTPSTSVLEYWEEGNIPWLQSGCCQNCDVEYAEKCITQLGYDNSSTKMMPPDTVMIALTGATAGKIGYLKINACGNQSITGILPCDALDQRYLFYYLMSQREQILTDCVGGAQAHISQGYVKDIIVPVLPLFEQKKISKKMSSIDQLISLRKQQLSKLDELVKARFVELFGDPATNEKGWSIRDLESVTTIVTYGLTVRPEYISEGIDLVSARELHKGYVDYDSAPKIAENDFVKLSEKGKPQKNDILFSKTGSIGHCALVTEEKPFAITQNAARIGLKSGTVNPLWLLYYLRMDYIQDWCKDHAKGNAVKDFQLQDMKVIPLFDCPLEVQNQFAAFVEQTDKSKFEIQQSLEKLETLKKALMQKYFG